jgi:hypothetical protein
MGVGARLWWSYGLTQPIRLRSLISLPSVKQLDAVVSWVYLSFGSGACEDEGSGWWFEARAEVYQTVSEGRGLSLGVDG